MNSCLTKYAELAEWLRFVKRGYHSFLYVLLSILGFLQLLEVLKVEYVLNVHRVTFYQVFKLPFRVVLPLLILLGVWILLMALQKNVIVLLFPFLSLVVYPYLGFNGFISVFSLLAVACSLWFYRDFESYLIWVFLIFSGFEALSLFHWLIFLPLGLKTPFEGIAQFEMELSHVLMNVGPYLVLIMVITSLLKPFTYLWEQKKEFKPRTYDIKFLKPSIFLMIILFFSVFSAIYPYLPNINELGVNVGVDTQAYLSVLKDVKEDPSHIFRVKGGSRSFFFLFFFTSQKILNLDTGNVLLYLPVLLNPILTLSVYFFSKEVFNNRAFAVWSAFFTVFGYVTTVGIYSSFYANILGLSLALFSIGFLFKGIKTSNKYNYIPAFLFAVLLIFTHPWTFDHYMLTLILALFLSPLLRARNRGKYMIYFVLFLFIVFASFSEVIRINFFQSYGITKALSDIFKRMTSDTTFWYDLIRGIMFRFGVGSDFIKLMTPDTTIWIGLIRGFKFMFGGLLLNMVPIYLMVVGILNLRYYKIQELYIAVLTSATSALFLIMGLVIKSRLFYNLPVGLLSIIGFITIINATNSIEMKISFTLFIIFNITTYLFRGLANLV